MNLHAYTPTMRTFLALVVTLCLAAPALAIPASSDDATKALKDSPRHGEWADIPLADGKTLRAFVAYPERADKAPVVVVIHEIFGLTDWVRGVADALAAEGYIAVAPDMLSGMAPNGGGTEGFEGDAVRNAIRELKPEVVNARLDVAREYALKLPAAAPKSAVIGFCWGGSRAFDYAIHQRDLNLALVYYGTGPKDVIATHAPVVGFYGGDDARVTSTVADTEKAMKDAGKSFEQHTYAGAGHGFLRQQTGRDGANERAAKEAWATTVAELKAAFEAK